MKPLAAVFATITVLAALLGFGMNVLPILGLLGRVAAAIALAGFTVTAIAYMMEELIAPVGDDADELRLLKAPGNHNR